MCGGRGRRLGELSERVPKPLAPLRGRTILDLKFEQYLGQGFSDFVLCVGYKAELIRQATTSWRDRASFTFSDAGEDAGILDRISQARPHLGEVAILTYGDTFADIDLRELLEAHRAGGRGVTMVTSPIRSPFGLVETDRTGAVTLFKEKPILNYYIGMAVLDVSTLDLVPPSVVGLPDGQGLVTFFKILTALDQLGVYAHPGLQITFNTPEDLSAAEKTLARFYTSPEVDDE